MALPHIFSDTKGHIKNMTEENLRRVIGVVNPKNLERIDEHGNMWYKKVFDGLGEIWVRTHDGKIDDAGLNIKQGIEGFLDVMSEVAKKVSQSRG